MPPSGCWRGPDANSVCGRFAAAALERCCSASSRSAGVPCRSPFVSFLYAYDTVMGLHTRQKSQSQTASLCTTSESLDILQSGALIF